MAKVTLEKVSKFYGDVEAVKKIDLEISDNEFLVLVGHSGCGKSSTLRMIAGLEEIDEGKIVIGEKTVNELEPRERNVSMSFQNYALYPHMTVEENLGFSLKIAGMKKIDIDTRVAEAAGILDIDEIKGSTKKIMAQKGSGGARHSTRKLIFSEVVALHLVQSQGIILPSFQKKYEHLDLSMLFQQKLRMMN